MVSVEVNRSFTHSGRQLVNKPVWHRSDHGDAARKKPTYTRTQENENGSWRVGKVENRNRHEQPKRMNGNENETVLAVAHSSKQQRGAHTHTS